MRGLLRSSLIYSVTVASNGHGDVNGCVESTWSYASTYGAASNGSIRQASSLRFRAKSSGQCSIVLARATGRSRVYEASLSSPAGLFQRCSPAAEVKATGVTKSVSNNSFGRSPLHTLSVLPSVYLHRSPQCIVLMLVALPWCALAPD